MARERIYLIAGGNGTVLFDGKPNRRSGDQSREILANNMGVQQIGFLSQDTPSGTPELRMMGDELSVNGLLAAAFRLGGRGEMTTSGLDTPVNYWQRNDQTSVRLDLPYKYDTTDENVILLGHGIGYLCSDQFPEPLDGALRAIAERNGLPASGIVRLQGDMINPFVRVNETGVIIPETSCGSASIVANILRGKRFVTQPTLQRMEVMRTDSTFTVTAKVTSRNSSIKA